MAYMNKLLLLSVPLYFFGFFNLLGINTGIAYTQLFNMGLAIVSYIIVKKIGREFFQVNSKLFYWFFIVVLIITFIIGFEAKGSRRWLDLYWFNFQGSELFKVFFILFFAQLLSEIKNQAENLSFFFKTIVFLILPAMIIFKQPDLGNALIYCLIFLAMILFSDIPKKYFLTTAILIVIVMPFFWFTLKDYQRMRITSFIRPEATNQSASYNMNQAIIAIGSGRLLGKGMGAGTQSRLAFLPENHTDFAFASLIEQFGLLGGIIVLGLFGLIAWQLIERVIVSFVDRTELGGAAFYYNLGFLVFFLSQVMINIGMNLGLLPVVGIALPLVSYGGSSLMTWLIGVALLP